MSWYIICDGYATPRRHTPASPAGFGVSNTFCGYTTFTQGLHPVLGYFTPSGFDGGRVILFTRKMPHSVWSAALHYGGMYAAVLRCGKRPPYFIFSIACCRSAMMSSAFSMPTERRMRSGATPASRSCSSESWRCVWLAGWRTQVRASAT